MWCCVKARTSHKLITHSRGLSRMPRPRKIFFTKRMEQYWQSQCDLQGPTWHDMKQWFYVVCQTYTKEKNQWNLTALHKELLCLDISFLPLYFCLGCRELFSRPRGSRAGKNNVGIQEGNCTCCLFSAVSAVTPKEASSLQTISYVNTIHQCGQVRKNLLHESPTQPMNSSEMKSSKSTMSWMWNPWTSRINVQN